MQNYSLSPQKSIHFWADFTQAKSKFTQHCSWVKIFLHLLGQTPLSCPSLSTRQLRLTSAPCSTTTNVALAWPHALGAQSVKDGYRLSCLHTLDSLQLCPEVVRFDWTRLSPRLKGLGHGLHGTLPPIKRRNEVLFHTKDDQAAPFPAKFSLQPWPAALVILPPPLWQKALPYPENMQSVMKTPKRTAPLLQAPRTLLKAPASTTDTDSRWIALQLQPEHVSEAQHIMHEMDISKEWDRGSQDTRTMGGDRLP